MDRKGKSEDVLQETLVGVADVFLCRNSVSTPAGSQWQLVVMETKPHCEIHLHETRMQ